MVGEGQTLRPHSTSLGRPLAPSAGEGGLRAGCGGSCGGSEGITRGRVIIYDRAGAGFAKVGRFFFTVAFSRWRSSTMEDVYRFPNSARHSCGKRVEARLRLASSLARLHITHSSAAGCCSPCGTSAGPSRRGRDSCSSRASRSWDDRKRKQVGLWALAVAVDA